MAKKRQISASEAADRIAQRFRRHPDVKPDEETIPPYQCENCGGSYFKVFMSSENASAVGELDDNHRIEWLERDYADGAVEQTSTEEHFELQCANCDNWLVSP